MKNLTIKKVALGILLAGYAASGAFALTATTNATIQGRAPTIDDGATSTPASGKYSFKVVRGGTYELLATDKLQVDDVIHITFKYNDEDGDATEADWSTTSKDDDNGDSLKFVFFNYDANATPNPITGSDVSAVKVSQGTVDGSAAEYTYTIVQADVGRTIGINLTPFSQYGDPDYGTRIKGNNLIALGTGPAIPPTVIPNMDKNFAYIYPATNVNASGNPDTGVDPLSKSGIPTVGSSYTVVVYDGANNQAQYLATNTVQNISLAKNIKWYLNGGNTNADATSTIATTVDYIVDDNNTNTSYTIPVNGSLTYAAGPSVAPKAGAQGFKLNVDVTF